MRMIILTAVFSHAVVTAVFEMGIIIPILNKPTLDPNIAVNYRPITLLSL